MDADKPAAKPEGTPSDSGRLLFTYGTLMLTTGIAAVDAATRDAGESLGRGFILGRLFDLGEYPGAVPLPGIPGAGPGWPGSPAPAGLADARLAGEGPQDAGFEAVLEDAPKVWGRLIRLKDPVSFYRVIDAYEGFDPAKPAESEFVRAETTVHLPDTARRFLSQVYFYNFPTGSKPAIGSGDYLAHWRAKGEPNQGRMQ
jgi:gamma-glutamylcyclotransferase (GGCT)/AIG2-like uncharacterized protein YtfP